MADHEEDVPVVKPKVSAWKMRKRESELFVTAEKVANWKLADKSRRLLMDLNYQLSNRIPEVKAAKASEIPAPIAQQVAISALAGITVRAVGSSMSLIACGYLPESAGPARRGLEAQLRARAILDDPSGQHARDWLTRPMQGWKKLADRYKTSKDLELFSIFAHADARSLTPLHAGPPGGKGKAGVREVNVDLRANRDDHVASRMLYALAHETVGMCATLVEPFGVAVQIPPWISSELIRLKEEGEARQAPA